MIGQFQHQYHICLSSLFGNRANGCVLRSATARALSLWSEGQYTGDRSIMVLTLADMAYRDVQVCGNLGYPAAVIRSQPASWQEIQ